MEGFDPKTSFGYQTSERYDVQETRGDEEETVAFLAQLASERDALEFAIGTGRIALPLMRTGVRVDGLEQSQHMVDRMREKPDGEDVHVAIGDMSRASMGRKYGLVYLVNNTIGNPGAHPRWAADPRRGWAEAEARWTTRRLESGLSIREEDA